VVRAAFSAGPVASPLIEWFVDDVERAGEPVTSTPMSAAAGGEWQASLPPQPDNSIVRYRVVGNRGAGAEVISPRPSDPYGWHAYFVSPVVNTTARVYQLFISRLNWAHLYDNIDFPVEMRRVNGCLPRDSWDEKVPAVFVVDGVVRDARVRYQGSRSNRLDGLPIDLAKTTIAPLPDRPAPLTAYSWNISLPRYAPLEKRQTLDLNKLIQACPGLNAGLGQRLYAAAGVPAARVKFARLHINGGYYHYMMDIEHQDDDFVKRYDPPRQPRGDLFKDVGCNCDEGPIGWGDERLLQPFCGYTAAQRYAATYERKTQTWRDASAVQTMIEGLNAARASLPDTVPLRNYFAQTFDVPSLLSYLAIRNWSEPWDDIYQNHFLYRRPADGKWILIPWDLDDEFGRAYLGDANSTFYIGEEDNLLKDGFIKAYRFELDARIRELDATVLAPANVKAQIDSAAADYSLADALASPAGVSCVQATEIAALKKFADDRHAAVMQMLP
jgi:hypothetical protein